MCMYVCAYYWAMSSGTVSFLTGSKWEAVLEWKLCFRRLIILSILLKLSGVVMWLAKAVYCVTHGKWQLQSMIVYKLLYLI